MSLCLLQLIKEWIGILFVVISSMFSSNEEKNLISISYNVDGINTNLIAISKDYTTKKIYNSKLPYTTVNVITEGEVGISYEVDGEIIELNSPIQEVLEVGTGPRGYYTGSITGYGGDCIGCSGNVSCKTPEGAYNLEESGEYYNDSEYGNLRIVAADNSLFSCGTVLEITATSGEPFSAIVLDTGIAMRSAWRNQNKVLIDVAFKSEDDPNIFDITDKSGQVKFEVKRWGW